MPYITYYTPIVQDKHGCFRVNGATKTDKDEAIRLTKQHVSFRDKETKIIRVDETEEFVYSTI